MLITIEEPNLPARVLEFPYDCAPSIRLRGACPEGTTHVAIVAADSRSRFYDSGNPGADELHASIEPGANIRIES
jgi:hypothetical protein